MGLVSVLTRWVPRTVLQRGAHLALQTVAWTYAGSTLEDPIVEKSYRKMLPYGRVRSRPNALAPHSLSLERHRAVWAFMRQRTSFFKAPLRMLHLAPEYCYLKRFKKLPNLDYVTADLNSPWADHHLIVMTFPSRTTHLTWSWRITCWSTWRTIDRVMQEFFRVMKPGVGTFSSPHQLPGCGDC